MAEKFDKTTLFARLKAASRKPVDGKELQLQQPETEKLVELYQRKRQNIEIKLRGFQPLPPVAKGRVESEAVRELRLLANQGDADACRFLAKMYTNGDGVAKDFDRAADLFRRAAALEEQEQARAARGEEVKSHKYVVDQPKKAQNTEVEPPEFKPNPFVSPKTKFESVSKLLAEQGVPERASAALVELAEFAVNDPPLFDAKIAAAGKVRSATPTKPHTLTHQQQEAVRRRRQAGEPVVTLADEFGVSTATISRAANQVSRAKS